MSSPTSNSEKSSLSFDKLDPRIQRWIWTSGWTELRDAQERAIPPILAGKSDVIIAASTASGKTEAAFLPILTQLAVGEPTGLAMYVSPLKALINDQWQRLETLAETLDIPVTPWHGDITDSRKTRFLKTPRGCLLITPESVEAMLMRQGTSVAGILAGLRYIVIDELHSFMGSERGKQLQSQLHRIEILLGRRICRIGLSATLGDMDGAKKFLRKEDAAAVDLIVAKDGNHELRVLIKGVVESSAANEAKGDNADEDIPDLIAKTGIAKHLFQVLRGSNNLVFPNSRSAVEFFADRLRRLCEDAGMPNEFWPHHGNLSRELREQTEAALKQRERPATAICTNTLELGIDIGAVKSVAQIGPAPSVASLRQRLGRSGRRKGEFAVLRGYVIEQKLSDISSLSDQLRESLVQSVAMVRLLTKGWYEPVPASGLHASTLVQQVLSVISQYGGLHARQIWEILCSKGAFATVSSDMLQQLLRHLGEKEIIFQDATGLILLAPRGEKIAGHYSFYAAFSSNDEFTIMAGGRTLGAMPVTRPLAPGSFIIFGGRRWQVVSISQEDLVIEVQPGAGGSLPSFDGNAGAEIHDRVRDEMRAVLRSNDPVPFLDQTASELLKQARKSYQRLNLDDTCIRQTGDRTQLLTWKGDVINDTILLLLQASGFSGWNEGVCITLANTTVGKVATALAELLSGPSLAAMEVAAAVRTKVRQKWDHLLPDELLNAGFAAEHLDLDGAMGALKELLQHRVLEKDCGI